MENVTYSSKCFWINAHLSPIYEESPCAAEGEEKRDIAQGLEGSIDTVIIVCMTGEVNYLSPSCCGRQRTLKLYEARPVKSIIWFDWFIPLFGFSQ